MSTPPTTQKQHITAILQALLVTFLWSTSWVLIKFGLADIPALTFAGLRYTLAFLLLLPLFFRSGQARELRKLPRGLWWALAGLGVVYYTLTQGTQFLGLEMLPAITFSLLLNLSAPLVAILGIFFLKEVPSTIQWAGIGVFFIGVMVYFYPVFIPAGLALGLAVGLFSVLSTSFGTIIGRAINRLGQTPPLTVTVVSMGIGGVLLLLVGLAAEPAPVMGCPGPAVFAKLTCYGWKQWGIILWLALVNTAFAFTLWNHTLRTLSAAESSIINNTMMVQIAVLAWIFLGERPGPMQFLGMAFALVGTILVNMKKSNSRVVK